MAITSDRSPTLSRRVKPLAMQLLILLTATATARADDTEQMFRPDRLLQVEVELPTSSWETLRFQHPVLNASNDQTFAPRVYTYFPGNVTINGTKVERVGIRKKGFIGSVTSRNPSLKVDFQEYVKELEFSGLRRMTLNNNLQDMTCLNQFLAYHLYRKAKLAAPRCNFALVSVNGVPMGVYSHVESIRKPFLARHFNDDDGNLYEGRRSDLRPDWIDTFDKKTNKRQLDRDDLRAAAAACELDGEAFVKAIEPLVDLDAFLRYWALEVLIGHWDGYSENLNNFYLYRDPSVGKFYFIPWGVDEAFGYRNPFQKYKPPISVRAVGTLCRKLYNHPPTRERYRAALKQLLDEVWNEEELLQLVERQDTLIKPHLASWQAPLHGSFLNQTKTFIQGRRQAIMDDLDQPPTDWTFPPEDQKGFGLKDPIGKLNIKFQAPWHAQPPGLNLFAGSKVEIDMQIRGETPELILSGAAAQRFPMPMRFGYPSIMMGGFQKKNGRLLAVSLVVDPSRFKPGELPIDMFDVMGALVDVNPLIPKSGKVLGFVHGRLKLDKASVQEGELVSGRVEGTIHSN